MRVSTFLAPALAATVLAAPRYPELEGDNTPPRSMEAMSEYFTLLASKVQASRYTTRAPSCDLSQARMPIAPEPLPPVSEGLTLKHVAVGRGTQNYTCDVGNATAVPQAAGAVASLFNVSCIAVAYPDLLALIPKVSMQFNLSTEPLLPGANNHRLGPSNAVFAGDHFFYDAKTPYFHIREGDREIGDTYCGLNSSTPAPAASAVGQRGEKAVAWLKLLTKDGRTAGDIQEIYRLTTAGGSPPSSCAGQPESFQVQYAAAYWFYAGPAPDTQDEDED
ncbi:hypothetical protein D7B24_006941 [Verticillium nonalfalfae]|uniref:Malate dehydrogenase n=1 Tax=Verticillium nonalfalfae TaxID=1051616 RepID=A0A3M9Y9A9_9PEZI|nr:uncharacterized protein D7B24_006941 [Verticillium nonalfalfae]RNJ56695.1 hypothetical protein D7B24_006941 [Verticillium nonalfalfae]